MIQTLVGGGGCFTFKDLHSYMESTIKFFTDVTHGQHCM